MSRCVRLAVVPGLWLLQFWSPQPFPWILCSWERVPTAQNLRERFWVKELQQSRRRPLQLLLVGLEEVDSLL